MDHGEFISIAESLPLEMKIELIERLVKSITPSEPAIDQLWVDGAERRVAELNAGTVRPIPGEEVFKDIDERFFKRNTAFIQAQKWNFTKPQTFMKIVKKV